MNFNSFDVNLFNKLCKSSDENKNIFFSPLSISLALSMLLLGSDEKTKEQLEDALGIIKNEELPVKLKALYDILTFNYEGLKIKLSNSIFPSQKFQMVSKYERDIKTAFKCEVQTLDYKENAETSKTVINNWVNYRTDGKIEKLFNSLAPEEGYELVCVIVSCIYFKGDWYDKFMSHNTCDDLFYCTTDKTATVKMMTQNNYYFYKSVDDSRFKCLKIPYKQRDFSMLIILPDDRFGVNDLIKRLDVKIIENLKDEKNFEKEDVLLKIPKFKMDYETSLKETLQLLRINDAFDEGSSDFSAMAVDALQPNRRLHVSEVAHKAFIETSEEGTEAAAATGMCLATFASRGRQTPQPIYFIVDHPFVFMILHKSQTLFMGKVNSL